MNQNERLAESYLIEMGFHPTFHEGGVIDFTTEEGMSFEVKTLEGKSITFRPYQFENITLASSTVLVYPQIGSGNLMGIFPLFTISSNLLKQFTRSGERMDLSSLFVKKSNAFATITFTIPYDTWEKFNRGVRTKKTTKRAVLIKAIEDWLVKIPA